MTGVLLSLCVSKAFDSSFGRVWLCVGQALNWVGLHLWCVDGVVGLSLELESISDIYLHVLFLLSKEGVCTRPCVATDNYNAKHLLSGGWVSCLVIGHITVGTHTPGRGVTLDLFIIINAFKSSLRWVLFHTFFHKVFRFNTFGGFLLHQRDSIAIQNRFSVMAPVFSIAHLLDGRDWDWALLGHVLLNFGGAFFDHFKHTFWHKGGAKSDAGNLRAQQVLLSLV